MHESRWPGLLFKTVSDPMLCKDQFCRIHGNRRRLHVRTPSVGVARDSETPAWHTDAGKTAGGVHSITAGASNAPELRRWARLEGVL